MSDMDFAMFRLIQQWNAVISIDKNTNDGPFTRNIEKYCSVPARTCNYSRNCKDRSCF